MINLVFPQAVSRESDFYDCVSQADRVNRAFLYDGQRVVLIMGERRIGKTSFMLVTQGRFAANLSHRFVSFFFSERSYMHSFKDFAKEILQRFCKHLGKQLSETDLLDDHRNFQEPSSQQLVEAFAILLKDVVNLDFIICIDEFDIFITQGNLPTEEALKILGVDPSSYR